MWWKNYVFQPAEDKQNATFSPEFTQPGKSLLEIPCTAVRSNRPLATHLTINISSLGVVQKIYFSVCRLMLRSYIQTYESFEEF